MHRRVSGGATEPGFGCAACAPAEQRRIHKWLHAAWRDPTAALKLAPLALMLLSVPFLFVSMVRGAPDPVYDWGNAAGAKKTR